MIEDKAFQKQLEGRLHYLCVMEPFLVFEQKLQKSIDQESIQSMRLVDRSRSDMEIKQILVKAVLLKKGFRLQLVYRYQTKDITKNLNKKEAYNALLNHAKHDYKQITLTMADAEILLSKNPKGKYIIKERAIASTKKSGSHDHQKHRLIKSDRSFLHALGVTDIDGNIKKDKQAKFRQINRFIELLDSKIPMSKSLKVADMGSGKAYLTFALYDHLASKKLDKLEVVGIEMRSGLVQQCNDLAQSLELDSISFRQGTIQENDIQEIDILVALHACDTATDDALIKGIQSNAQLIVVSPCCHKQVRKAMNTQGALAEITNYGTFKERQAELLTDTIRSLYLQAYGYKVTVSEFVATSHTPKNILIMATKGQNKNELVDRTILDKINDLKSQFEISHHYLDQYLV